MESFCTPPAVDSFAARLLADTDCQAFGLVERGYAALAQPGGTMSTALTGLMVIAVAFFGYRLLLGRGTSLSDAIALSVKIGVVLLIATSWESWQALAYNSLARGPAQIASEMLVGMGARPPLESLQTSLNDLAAAGVGYRTRAGIASPLVGGPAAAAMTLNLSAVLLTLATVGVLVATRVVLAVLLAIAPAMAGFLLFAATRGIAQAWIGAMASAALAPLFVLVVAAVEFAVLSPMIARLLAEQAGDRFETASVMPIGLVTIVFAVAMVLAARAGGRIGRGVRLTGWTASAPAATASSGAGAGREGEPQQSIVQGPRADVVRALDSISRREAPAAGSAGRSFGGARASIVVRDARGSSGTAPDRGEGGAIVSPIRSARPMASAQRRSRAASRRDA